MGLLRSSKGSALVMILVFSAIFLLFCGGVMKISEYILNRIEDVSEKMQADYLASGGLQLVTRRLVLDEGYKEDTWKICPILCRVEKNGYFMIKKVEKEGKTEEFEIIKVEVEGRFEKWSNKIKTKLNMKKGVKIKGEHQE
ncbi:hypothetical protein KJ997_03470 [bacterium]|nr:hypothetical protein [bacterium]